MIQFYVLSIVFNILGGLALCAELPARTGPAFEGLRAFLRDRTVRLVLGILAIVTGGLKFVTSMRGDIPVVGDFLPALAGIAVGGTLLVELYSVKAPNGQGEDKVAGASAELPAALRTAPGLERFLIANKVPIGLAAMAAGLLHFLFPMVIFL